MGLPVVYAQFKDHDIADWQELFEGYDELRAITFSSGVRFMENVLDGFSYAEVVFGCPDILSREVSVNMMPHLIGYNKALMDLLTKSGHITGWTERIREGSLSFYAARDMKSHEKLFLLKGKDGKKRVITGSANFSSSAFNGIQREIIIVFDDDEAAYGYYEERFEAFKAEGCSDSISYDIIKARLKDQTGDDLSHLPVLSAAAGRPVVVQVQASEEEREEDREEVVFVTDLSKIAEDIRKEIPKPKRNRSAGETVLLQPSDLSVVLPKIRQKRIRLKQKRAEFPKLHLNMEEGTLSFNGQLLDLYPDKEAVKHDAECFTSYMNGLDIAFGAVQHTKDMYFLFTCWLFSSIFMPYLRLTAHEYSYSPLLFPVYGILYGQTNAGKSTLMGLLMRMMTGVDILKAQDSFNKTNIQTLKCTVEGVPVFFDDPDMQNITRYAGDTIKDDDFGILESLENYPAVVIASNAAPSIPPELAKRCLMCHVDSRIDRTAGVKASKRVGDAVKTVTNALFREYVRLMLPLVRGMVEKMKEGDDEWMPDILLSSSEVLSKILSENIDISGHTYIRKIRYNDWADEKEIGHLAVEKIKDAWRRENDRFTVDRRHNELIYTYPEGSNLYELKHLANELPACLQAQKMSKTLVMKLDEAERVFGFKFQKNIISFIRRR